MNKNVKIKFEKYDTSIFKPCSYYDLSDFKIDTNEDLAQVCDVFRNPKYEIFRVLYIKENKIVGQESITSKIPNAVKICRKNHEEFKMFEKMKNRMKRLNADGYYLTHNHTTESSKPSKDDIRLTGSINDEVGGFLGHIVLNNSNKYSLIIANSSGDLIISDEMINKNASNLIKKELKDKSIYDVKITNRDELVALLKQIDLEKDYSVAVLTDCKCNVRMVLDIPNRIFNDQLEAVNGYFKNIARECGSTRVFVGTQNEDVYSKIFKHQDYGTIKDFICFDNSKEKELTYLASDRMQNFDLFDDKYKFLLNKLGLAEENLNIYRKEENDMENKLKILMKKVGQDPFEMEIEDTLEAKQELVDGLIEVVPYEDALLICNEEGKLLDLKPNLKFDYDYIAGDCFIVGDDYENAGFKSLTKDEIKKYSEDLKNRSFKYLEFMKKDNKNINKEISEKELR